MQQLIKQIGNKYQNQIKSISQASATELNILLNEPH